MGDESPKQRSQSTHHFLQFFFSFAHSLSIVTVNYKNQALEESRKDSFQQAMAENIHHQHINKAMQVICLMIYPCS